MASLAMALATNVLPVPGGPSNRTPRRDEPPMVSRKVWWARKRLMERTTSALMGSMPTRSSRPTWVSPGRISVCGERPAARSGASMTAPSMQTMRRMGRAVPSPCGRWNVGKMPWPADPADDDPAEDERADRHQTAQAGDAAALTGPSHVGAAEDGVAHDPEMRRDRRGWRRPGRAGAGTFSAGRLMTDSVHSPVDVSNVENPTGPMTLRSDKSHKCRELPASVVRSRTHWGRWTSVPSGRRRRGEDDPDGLADLDAGGVHAVDVAARARSPGCPPCAGWASRPG